ncbi:hypothetical protein HDU78_009798 [Chytriomyces hyalinus]|nr:hypothetical protein HDU78_009798 [Chytriomyces hyalinus]
MSSGGEQQKFVPVTSLDCLSTYDAWLVKTSEHYGFTYHGRDVGFSSGINKASDRRYSTSGIAHFIFGLDDREISGGIHFAKLNESTKFQGAARWFSVCGNHKKTELKQLVQLAAEKAELKRMVMVVLELTKQDVAANTRGRLSPRSSSRKFETELRHLESLHLFPSASVTTMGDHTLSHMSGLQFTQSSPNVPPTASAAERYGQEEFASIGDYAPAAKVAHSRYGSDKSKRSHSNEVSEDSVSFSEYHYKPHCDKKDAIPLLTAVISALEERARVTEMKRQQEIINVKPLDSRWWSITSRTRKNQHLEAVTASQRDELKVINDLKIEACKLLQKVEVSLLLFVEQSVPPSSSSDAQLSQISSQFGFERHGRDESSAEKQAEVSPDTGDETDEDLNYDEASVHDSIPIDIQTDLASRQESIRSLADSILYDLKIEACKLLQKVEVSLVVVVEQSSCKADTPSIATEHAEASVPVPAELAVTRNYQVLSLHQFRPYCLTRN